MTTDILEYPDWEGSGRIHNWRDHVGNNTQRIWNTFTREQKYAIMLDAERVADYEEWD